MNVDEVKEGVFIRWSCEGYMSAWDAMGKILKVEDKRVTVITFDDFKETEVDLNGDAVKNDMTVITKTELQDYLDTQVANLSKRKIDIDTEYRKKTRDIVGKLEKTEALISEEF